MTAVLIPLEPWHERAECATRQANPAWFDDRTDEREHENTAAVRHAFGLRYCRDCPVQLECLTDATVHDDTGVRGGTVLVSPHGHRAGTMERRNRAATARAVKALQQLDGVDAHLRGTPPRAGVSVAAVSGGTGRVGGATPHSETPPDWHPDGVSDQPARTTERTSS